MGLRMPAEPCRSFAREVWARSWTRGKAKTAGSLFFSVPYDSAQKGSTSWSPAWLPHGGWLAGQPPLSFSIHPPLPPETEKRSWSQAVHPAIWCSRRLPLAWTSADPLPHWVRRCLQPEPRLLSIHHRALPLSGAIPCWARAIWTVTSSRCWYGCLRALKAMDTPSKSLHVTKMTYFPYLSEFKSLVNRLHRAYFWLGKHMLFSTVDFFNWWCLRWFMGFQEPKSNHITGLFLYYYPWSPFKAQFKGHL